MQDQGSLRIVRPPGERSSSEVADRRTKPLTAEDKRAFFKGVVVNCLDAGFLRYSRRQELLKIAEQLGIGEFEACLLIAEAQFHSDTIDPVEAGNYVDDSVASVAGKLSKSFMHIGTAIIAAALVDIALVVWLL